MARSGRPLMDTSSPLRQQKFPVRVLAYAGGIMDADGTFGAYFSRHKGHLVGPKCQVKVAMSEEAVIRWFQAQFGGRIGSYPTPRRTEMWYWHAHQGDVIPFCKLLLPFLIAKRRQARYVMAIRSCHMRGRPPEKQIGMVQSLQDLKLRVKVPSSSEAICQTPKTGEEMVRPPRERGE